MLYPNIPKEILMDPVNEESVKNVFYDFLIQKKKKTNKYTYSICFLLCFGTLVETPIH